jgi:hypothetical protein
MYFPTAPLFPYILATTTKILTVSTPTSYYYVINLNFYGIALALTGSSNSVQYTKIA